MKRFAIVCAQEFREALRSKSFIVISVFLAVMLLMVAVGGLLIGGLFTSGDDLSNVDYTGDGAASGQPGSVSYLYEVAVCDRSGDDTLERLRAGLPHIRFESMELTDLQVEELLTAGECDAYVVLNSACEFEIYEQYDLYGESLGEHIREALVAIGRIDMLGELGVDAAQAGDVLNHDRVMYTLHTVGGYDIGEYIYNYVLVILMFLVIALYGQMVATRVATEKGSRTMEVLATSVSPVELLCGKVMGVGLAGLLQMGVFIAAAAAIIRGLVSRSDILSVVAGQILDISAFDIACMVLFFVLGFLLYAFIFGALGSMVSQLEDLSGLASMPMYIFMVGYFISLFSTAGGQSGIIMKIASFVPFWSPVVMFARMSMEEVSMAELFVSLAILVVTAGLIAWWSARIYRSGMLRYGKPPKLSEIINAAKTGK